MVTNTAIDYELFLGFPFNLDIKKALDDVPNGKKLFFIQKDPNYLRYIKQDEKIYLGKTVGDLFDLNHLNEMHLNIESLLKELMPMYHFDQPFSFIFLAITKESND